MSILYSKLRLEVPLALDGQNATITSSKGGTRTVQMSSPITDVMLAGMESYRVQAGVTDENVNFGYGQIKKVGIFNDLEHTPWADIATRIQAGTFASFSYIGDTKTFVINNKTYTAEVVSINDGTGDAASWYPANTVDFICKELYETTYKYNASDTNTGGFPSSAIKATLESTIYPLLPSDLKDVIIDKSHNYTTSNSATTTTATKLWLPTQYELSGATSAYASGETSSNNKQYTLSSTIKMLQGQSSASFWWLGTFRTSDTQTFWNVSTNGNVNCGLATSKASLSYGVPLCFRIG